MLNNKSKLIQPVSLLLILILLIGCGFAATHAETIITDSVITADAIYAPTGRTATFVVAASDSSALSKQQADYVCDGTDDQVQIQAAIDALPAHPDGGSILLLEGTFNISATINFRGGCTLKGQNMENTVLKATSALNNTVLDIIGVGASIAYFPQVSDLKIFGYKTNANNIGIHVHAGGGGGTATDGHYKDIFISDCGSHGLKLENSAPWGAKIESCLFEYNVGYGIFSDGSNQCIISNCFIAYNEGAYGILLSSSDSIVSGNTVYQNDNHGILVAGNGNNIISGNNIRDNGIVGTGDGIWVDTSSHNNIITNNIIDGNSHSRYGVHITSDNNTITNNRIKDCVSGTINNIGDGNVIYDRYSDLFMDVLAVSATHVRSNEDLSAATPITFTLDAQPDIPRTLSWSFDTHAQITEYDMEVIGIDAKGSSITETWDETAGWSGETNNAFATITSIKMTSRTGTGAADTMDIGITDVLGLSNVIYETSDVFKIKKNNANAVVATAQVNTTYDTYDMSVITLGAGDDFTIWYKSNLNILS